MENRNTNNPMEPSVVHQDNQSAMLLGTNGKGSSGKRTRHMNIRYFFVADVQERKQIVMEYCPTDEMIGDFFTKPLQGAKFRRFRNIIMNITEDENGPVNIDEIMEIHYKKMQQGLIEPAPAQNTALDSQECVGNQNLRVTWADQEAPTHTIKADARSANGKPDARAKPPK